MSYWSKEEEERLLAATRLELLHSEFPIVTINGAYLEISRAEVESATPRGGFITGWANQTLIDIKFNNGQVVTVDLTHPVNEDSQLHISDLYQISPEDDPDRDWV